MRKQYTIAVFLGIFVAVLFYVTLEEHYIKKNIFESHKKKLNVSLTNFIKYFFEGNLRYIRTHDVHTHYLFYNLKTKRFLTDQEWMTKKHMSILIEQCRIQKTEFFQKFDNNMEFLVKSKRINSLFFIVFTDMTLPMNIISKNKNHFLIFIFVLLIVVFAFIKFITDENITQPYKKVLNELKVIRHKGIPHKINISVKNEFQEVIESFNLTVTKLQTALDEVNKKNDFINQQISLAGKVQKAFLPSKHLNEDSFSIIYKYRAASFLSGDFFGFKKIHGYIYFYVGDISGKGLSSALIMSAISTLIHQEIILSPLPPDDIIYQLNETLVDILPSEKFITLQMYRFNLDNNIIEYSNAGHPAPFEIFTEKSSFKSQPEVPSAPIGFFPHWQKNLNTFTLNPGDKLLIYTDGLTELRANDGKLLHKLDIPVMLSNTNLGGSSKELLDFLYSTVNKYSSVEFQDDLTILIFENKV